MVRQKTLNHSVADVRFGSKADVTLLNFDVRFTPESGHSLSAFWMSALGHKQTSRLISDESVYHSISDIGRRWSHGSAIIACRADWQYEFKTGAMRICL